MPQPIHFTAQVEHIERHAEGIATYRIKADRRLPRFLPGQFIHLALDKYTPSEFWPESRVFSVANAVRDRHTIQLTISRQRAFTSRILGEVKVGSMVWGKGPYGDFVVDDKHGQRRATLIAGGTGITPFCAFMDEALISGQISLDEVVLHYGAQTPELLIYRGLATSCAQSVPGFDVRYYAEHSVLPHQGEVLTGSLDIDKIVESTNRPKEMAYYISGPRAMIDGFMSQLRSKHQIPRELIFVDAWN